MRFPRLVVLFLCLSWALVALYPDPAALVDSVRNLMTPPIQPDAVGALAARLPDDPGRIEELVLADVVPYASDWESAGVPWSFPTTAQVLRAGRGDCESRALVVASVLAAKGIPYELRMSFDHIWVDYPGKVPTANENDALVMAGRDGGGWFGLRWPKDVDLWRDARAQVDIYWTPMPTGRRALFFLGLAAIACWNALAMRLIALPGGTRQRRQAAMTMKGPAASTRADGSS